MTEKPKETPKEELECPKKYVYDTGIIFECKDNIRVQIIGEDVVDLLNELATKCRKLEKENEQLKKVLGAILLEVKQDITNTNQTGEIKVFINPNSFEMISEVLRKYGALKDWYE